MSLQAHGKMQAEINLDRIEDETMKPSVAAIPCFALFLSLCGCTDQDTNASDVDDVGSTASSSSAPAKRSLKPHIVYITSDDLGADLGPCLNDLKLMPNMEKRCSTSLVFERAYANPYCTPTRAGILTGRYSYRHGANDVYSKLPKLPLAETTIPEKIKETGAGYRSAAFGKWHLSYGENETDNLNNPSEQGFDYFEGNPRQYYTYNYFTSEYRWYVNGEDVGWGEKYKPVQVTDAVLNDFQSRASGPQFYFVNYVIPHIPLHVPPRDLHSFDLPDEIPDSIIRGGVKRDPKADKYVFAMLEALDGELERLVSGLSESTQRPIVFVFMGDNGTANDVYQGPVGANEGWYRGKSSLYEGGVRVPLMIWSSHPGDYTIPTDRTDMLVHSADLFPTFFDIAGEDISTEELDGLSFYKVFDDLSYESREMLYNEGGHDRKQAYNFTAIDQEGKKLLVQELERRRTEIGFEDLVSYFDIRNDPGEQNNLLKTQPCAVNFQNVDKLLEFMREMRENRNPDLSDRFAIKAYRAEIESIKSACDATENE
jgi:arylsulfatase A-like enzyme